MKLPRRTAPAGLLLLLGAGLNPAFPAGDVPSLQREVRALTAELDKSLTLAAPDDAGAAPRLQRGLDTLEALVPKHLSRLPSPLDGKWLYDPKNGTVRHSTHPDLKPSQPRLHTQPLLDHARKAGILSRLQIHAADPRDLEPPPSDRHPGQDLMPPRAAAKPVMPPVPDRGAAGQPGPLVDGYLHQSGQVRLHAERVFLAVQDLPGTGIVYRQRP